MRLTGRLNQITNFSPPPSSGTGMLKKCMFRTNSFISVREHTTDVIFLMIFFKCKEEVYGVCA